MEGWRDGGMEGWRADMSTENSLCTVFTIYRRVSYKKCGVLKEGEEGDGGGPLSSQT